MEDLTPLLSIGFGLYIWHLEAKLRNLRDDHEQLKENHKHEVNYFEYQIELLKEEDEDED